MLNALNHGPYEKKRDLSSTDFGFTQPNPSLLDRDICLDPPVTQDHMHSKRSYAGGRTIRRQSTTLTPGYTTSDDFGTDGDDTPHSKIPYYSQPNDFQANGSFPTNGSLPATVDLIFLDFIAADAVAALGGLGANYTLADVSYYLPEVSQYLLAYRELPILTVVLDIYHQLISTCLCEDGVAGKRTKLPSWSWGRIQ